MNHADLLAEAASQLPVDPDTYAKTQAACLRLIAVERELEEAENVVKALKKEREELRIDIVPELMFKLDTNALGVGNHLVEIEAAVKAALPRDEDKRKAAIDWLVDHKHGGVVRRNLWVSLPKGDAAAEHKALVALKQSVPNLFAQVVYDVHHMTYTALCTRLVKSGEAIPLETLGIFVRRMAKVK